MNKQGGYVTTIRETTMMVDQYEAFANDKIMKKVNLAKDSCFKHTDNADDFAICSYNIINAVDIPQLRQRHVFYDLKLQMCMQRHGEIMILACIVKLKSMLTKELKSYD